MFKKMIILAVVGFVGVSVLAGTKIGSYIRSEFNEARKRAEDSIPPEREITRLRNEVKLLERDKMTLINQLAKERVAVQELQADINARAEKQSREKDRLTGRAKAIKDATEFVKVGNRQVSKDEATASLEAEVKHFKAQQQTLDTMNKTLATRTKIRDSLERQLEALKAQEKELTTAIDGLEAELSDLKLQQTESKYQTDDSRLAKIKEDMRKLQSRVNVEREKLKLMPQVYEPATPASSKSLEELEAELNSSAPKGD